MIMGDLNERVGRGNERLQRWLEGKGEETRKDSETRIIDYCRENDHIIANIKFEHKEVHKIIREKPSKKERSIIKHFIVNATIWERIKNIRVKRGVEIGSDHYLVQMELTTYESKKIQARGE
ncbi:hypothetical protein ILUMI_13790 [Ignelater luminosus]|uniref:Craniofacial development protein 2-like n=1 Tax=Ignelater luminosus TaxID=2038154 RepID=A0A8K0CTR7_IGNLU|nr:hypothetical protein ILUMI_13790 [Ignelater luminosus]